MRRCYFDLVNLFSNNQHTRSTSQSRHSVFKSQAYFGRSELQPPIKFVCFISLFLLFTTLARVKVMIWLITPRIGFWFYCTILYCLHNLIYCMVVWLLKTNTLLNLRWITVRAAGFQRIFGQFSICQFWAIKNLHVPIVHQVRYPHVGFDVEVMHFDELSMRSSHMDNGAGGKLLFFFQATHITKSPGNFQLTFYQNKLWILELLGKIID